MKPTFALDLTREAIGLLHRTPKGWLSIGDVAFDAPDLAEALDYLRKTALGLSPMGVATKLILPNSQILYTEVHAPGPSRDEKRRQIAAALEGRTPYAVEDLVFDWSGKGATVKVAVIAKETLAEAEGFAVEHRLNPVSFVAVPEEGTFVGEPWFGPTAAAASLLAEDETVERDREPVTILHRELPKAEPAARLPAAAPAEPAPTAVDDDPLPGLEEALNADLTEIETPVPSKLSDEQTDILDDIAEDDRSASPAESLDTPSGAASEDPVAVLSEATDHAEVAVETAPVPPPAPKPEPEPEPEPEEAPFAHVTDTSAFPDGEEDRPTTATARRLVADDPDDDLPPAPSAAAMVAFASRRAAAADAVSRPMDGVTRPAAAAAAKAGIARPAPSKGYTGLVTAPSIPGTRAKTKVKGGDIPRPAIGPTTVKSPARPGGTFGSAVPAKKRSGTVFMVLVGLLLLFLALIGLWSSMYLGGSATTTQGSAATEVVPDVSDEMLADMQDPQGMTGPLPEADLATNSPEAGALATDSLPVNIGGTETVETAVAPVAPTSTEPAPETTVASAPEPAPGTTIATDVAAAAAPVEDQDEIFLSAMDAPPPALDALALPALTDVADALPDPVMPPPAPGTVYRFDARGLLVPTPEGIISPDGVMLIAGPPPVVPPQRSAVASAAALAVASTPAPTVEPPSSADASLVTAGETAPDAAPLPPADPAMAGFRPRSRPEGLTPVPADDNAALGTAAATDVAVLRPLPRPASVVTAAAVVLPASATPADLGAQGASLTAQAEAKLAEAAALEAQNPSIVAISMRPATRPRDLSRAVEAAVAAAVRAPAPEEAGTVEVAAAAPEAKPEVIDELNEPETTAAAPSIPTRASVAKQATYANAINLSKINLIGTYGTDSRRYALVRQSNGKYKKVKVGDKIDGGTVKAITDTEVRYQKGGRLVSLKMPKA